MQFNHRLLAITSFVLIVVYWLQGRNTDLPDRARTATNALLHTGILQVALGISTLLLAVPMALGALSVKFRQNGSSTYTACSVD